MLKFLGFVSFLLALSNSLCGPLSAEGASHGPAPGAFEQCTGCHTLSKNGSHGFGPNLYGVFGRQIASIDTYKYSDALLSLDGVWNEDTLNRYIARPKILAPGNAMSFPGITNRHTRKVLIEWLKSNPDYYDPPQSNFMQMVEQADTMRGASIGRRCLVCHSVDPDGSHSIGPNLLKLVGRDIASLPNFDYSERLTRLTGEWTVEELNRFMMAPKAFDQGSHRAFQSLTRTMDRAALIAWLTTLR